MVDTTVFKFTLFFSVTDPILPLLLQVLNLNQKNLQGLIQLNELVDPVVSDLVFLLVKCARDKDTTVSGLAAKCLGCIGAIDPGTLNPHLQKEFE